MKVLVVVGVGLAATIYGVISGQILALLVGIGLIAVALSGRLGTTDDRIFGFIGGVSDRIWRAGWIQLWIVPLVLSAIAGVISLSLPLSPWNGILWLLAIGLIVVSVIWHDRTAETASEKIFVDWGLTDWILLIAITGFGIGLRLYLLNGILPPFHGDEGEMGDLALRVLQGASLPVDRQVPLFGTAFQGHPTLFHFVQAGAMLVFGQTDVGLRLLSVLSGGACISLVYLIGRMIWKPIAASVAAWLMAVSHFHIQYSRIALNNIESVLFMMLMIFAFSVIFQQNNKTRLFWPMVIGLCLGLAQYFYYGSRLLLVVAPVLAIVLWLQKRLGVKQIGVALVSLAVAWLPLLIYYQQHVSTFTGRTETVFVLTEQNVKHTLGPDAKLPDALPALLLNQTRSTLGFFWQTGRGDSSAFYWPDIGGFDVITDILFWLGMATVIARLKNFHYFSMFAWFWIGITLSGILTNDAPNGPRMIVAVPAMYLIAGSIIHEFEAFLARFKSSYVKWVPVGLAVALAIPTLSINFDTYYSRYQTYLPNTLATAIAREMTAGEDQCTFYMLGLPYLSVNYGTIRFIARETDRIDIKNINEISQQSGPNQPGTCVIVLPAYDDQLKILAARYPEHTTTRRYDAAGRPLFTTFTVLP